MSGGSQYVIWKWPASLRADGRFTHSMPAGARILTVQVQNGEPQVWALVDRTAPQVHRSFAWIGSGHEFIALPGDAYVGTIQLHDGEFVFHLFVRAESAP